MKLICFVALLYLVKLVKGKKLKGLLCVRKLKH
jgi:hypothetical protein